MVLSPVEVGIAFAVFMLLVGYRRLPSIGRNLGEAVGELRKDRDEDG